MADALTALDAIPRELLPAALTRIAARLLEPVAPEPTPAGEDLLDPADAAKLLGVDRRWVIRHGRELGAIHLTRRKVRVSRRRVLRYIEARK